MPLNLSDGELRRSAEAFERRAIGSGVAVVVGLLLEVVLAMISRNPDWGPVVSNSIVAVGVVGELVFARLSWPSRRSRH